MAGVFPISKLIGLVVKQISKPIANFIKDRAKTHPFFRKYVCMPPAQLYNWYDVKTKMWTMNLGKPIKVPTLNEAMAIELGANLLGETIIFIIAAGLVLLEVYRQSRNEDAKEAARVSYVTSLYSNINKLAFQIDKQNSQLREVLELIGDLDTRVVKNPLHQLLDASGMQEPALKPETIKEHHVLTRSPFDVHVGEEFLLPKPIISIEDPVTETNNYITCFEGVFAKKSHHNIRDVCLPSVSELNTNGVVMQALKYLEVELYGRRL